MNINSLPDFQAQVHGPDGEQPVIIEAPAQEAADAAPIPSRQRVAEVVDEVLADHGNGNIRLCALLRKAAGVLYQGCGDESEDDRFVFPHALLVQVLTRERVADSLTFERLEASAYSIEECLNRICGHGVPDELGRFARVFATLVLCNQERDIFQFFRKGVDDTMFPLKAVLGADGDSGTLCPTRGRHTLSDFPCGWSYRNCDEFVNTHWTVFLPYFDDKPANRHQNFPQRTTMPWYNCRRRISGGTSSTRASSDNSMNALGGANSEVSRVFIYDGHHKFSRLGQARGDPVSFAVKRLKTKDRREFDQEVTMLRKLGGKKPHTVTLLATFCYGGTYCLLFPWAECDLLSYWRTQEPSLHESRVDLVRWVSDQCHGLIAAIEWIHDSSGAPGEVLDPKNNEPLFGRHGDIKPENILWYRSASHSHGNPQALGVLQLSDFGLSALNHKDTCTNIKNGDINHTTAYAPPESVLENHVISRAIDIWALGCVFLEFTTWLVGGTELYWEFFNERFSPFLGDSTIQNNVFWQLQSVDDDDSVTVKVVKPQVVKWIEDLWNRPEATQYIRDFLNVIIDDMLVPDKPKRKVARQVVPKLSSLVGRDEAYYTAPLGGGNKVIEVNQAPPNENLSRNVSSVIRHSRLASGKPLPRFSGHLEPNTGVEGTVALLPGA